VVDAILIVILVDLAATLVYAFLRHGFFSLCNSYVDIWKSVASVEALRECASPRVVVVPNTFLRANILESRGEERYVIRRSGRQNEA
jgi:hypothetical protein